MSDMRAGSGSLWPEDGRLPDSTGTPAHEAVAEEINLIAEENQAPIFARAVTADKVSVIETLKAFETKSVEVANSLAIEVKDQATYDLAALNFTNAKTFIEEATAYIEPFRLVTYNLYQKVMDRKKAIVSKALETNLDACRKAILRFEQVKEEERRQKQIEDERKAKEEEETRKINLAAAAESAGMSQESVEAILETPTAVPRPVTAPTFQKAAGLGKTRENWKAEPANDEPDQVRRNAKALYELVKAAAKKDGKHLIAFLQVNDSALNAHAKATKTAMQVPGYKAVDEGTLVRSR